MNVIRESKNSFKRIETLDWLRGLTAISIMLYHLYSWSFSNLDSSTFLGRLGIYGVSIFFVLSGLSMAMVYKNKIFSLKSIVSFLLKRFFRIIPLLFLVTTGVVFLKGEYDLKKYILNVTGLFGIFDYDNYFAVGAWSIGNEIVYYLFTPLILFLFDKKRLFGNLIFAGTVLLGMYYSYYQLNDSLPLGEQWATYINPFNNFFLYVAGIFIYYNFGSIKFGKKTNYILLILSFLFFIFYPVSGNQIKIVTDINRIALCVVSVLIVFTFFKLEISLPKSLEYLLEKLGLATYGVYLYHLVIYGITSGVFLRLGIENDIFKFVTVCVITVITSLISYYFFEIKISNFGKKMIKKYLQNDSNYSSTRRV